MLRKFSVILFIAAIIYTPAFAQYHNKYTKAPAGGEQPDWLDGKSRIQVEKEMEAYERSLGNFSGSRPITTQRYQNIGYLLDLTTKPDQGGSFNKLKYDMGGMVQLGNIFLFQAASVKRLVSFGADLTWVDFSFAKYKKHYQNEIEDDEVVTYKRDINLLSIGVSVGLTAHITPLANSIEMLRPLTLNVYGRFSPAYSAFIYGKTNEAHPSGTTGCFVPGISYGASLNYKMVGIGMEMTSGEGKYTDFLDLSEEKISLKNNSTRIYLSLHF